jgi:hypothetical protein
MTQEILNAAQAMLVPSIMLTIFGGAAFWLGRRWRP